jgi:hypothetical protein
VLTKSPRWNPGIQNGKPVRTIFSSDPNSNSGLMLEKESKYSEEIAQRAISSRYGNFVFRLSSFGIIDYLYERLSLDMNIV